jgi:hypothetical protein
MVAARVAALEACEQGKDCLYEQAQSDRSLLRALLPDCVFQSERLKPSG